MKYVLVNYKNDPSWIGEYTDDYLVIDDSGELVESDHVVKGSRDGNVDYAKPTYPV